MKRLSTFFRLLSLTTVLVLSSCGSDKMQSATTPSGSNNLTGECACAATYMPVCGYNNITYDNLCQAKCYVGEEANKFAQGRCNCSSSGPVCGDDNKTYESECDAQAAIRNGYMKKIVKYADCKAASY